MPAQILGETGDGLESRPWYRFSRDGLGRRLGFMALVLVAVSTWVLWENRDRVVAAIGESTGMNRVESRADLIAEAALESGVDPHLLAAIMYMESRGQVDAKSSAGALGLMQLAMASAGDAAMRLGLQTPTEEELLSDAKLNVRLGANHVAWLLEHRGDWTLEQVLVSYNAGRAKLFRWIRRHGSYNAWCAEELRLQEAGEPTTGALAYAQKTLRMRAEFEQRGVIEKIEGLEVE